MRGIVKAYPDLLKIFGQLEYSTFKVSADTKPCCVKYYQLFRHLSLDTNMSETNLVERKVFEFFETNNITTRSKFKRVIYKEASKRDVPPPIAPRPDLKDAPIVSIKKAALRSVKEIRKPVLITTSKKETKPKSKKKETLFYAC